MSNFYHHKVKANLTLMQRLVELQFAELKNGLLASSPNLLFNKVEKSTTFKTDKLLTDGTMSVWLNMAI